MSNQELVWAAGLGEEHGRKAGNCLAAVLCHRCLSQHQSPCENPLSSYLGSSSGTGRGYEVSGAFPSPAEHAQLSQPVSPQATQQSPALDSMINPTAGTLLQGKRIFPVSFTGKRSRTITNSQGDCPRVLGKL